MGEIQQALQAFYEEMKFQGMISYAEIARRSGISENQVGCLIDGRRRLNEDNLLAIISAMGLRLSDLDMAEYDAEHSRLSRMMKELLDAGGSYGIAIKTSTEALYKDMLEKRQHQQPAMKKAAGM